MFVLGTVANNRLDLSIVSTNGNGEAHSRVTGHDEVKVVLADAGLACCSVEE